MGIFDQLKNAIFSRAGVNQAQTSAAGQPSSTVTPAARTPNVSESGSASASSSGTAPRGSAASSPASSSSTAGASSGSAQQVDLQTVLQGIAAKKPEKLNWQSSIVDLMKLVDLNPSLENRKALASELGYTGDMQDSASMNTWLHRQVMQQLAASGGRVPDSLRH